LAENDLYWLLSLLLAEYAANQKYSAVLLCSADSIYPSKARSAPTTAPYRRKRKKTSEKQSDDVDD